MTEALKTGMVLSSVKAPDTYNEIVRIFSKNGKRMVEISQFSKTEEDKTVYFEEKELIYSIKRGIAYIVNNWQSRAGKN